MAAKKKTSKKSPAKAKKGKARGGRPPKGTPTKSDFIRAKIAAGMSAADIVKAGADAGMKIAAPFVYKLKSKMTAAGGKAAASAKGKPGPKPKDGKVSASDFVRQHPGKSASEVVELAKKAGVKVNAGLVYTVRAYDKRKGSGGGGAAPKGKPGRKAKSSSKILTVNFEGNAAEEQFKKLLVTIGRKRAEELLREGVSWGVLA